MSSIMRQSLDHVNQSGRTAPDAPPDDVLEAVHAVMHAVRAHQQRALRDAGHELSPLEGRVLAHFARHPGSTQSELAAHSGRDKGQLARLVGGLKQRGLLQAQVDSSDRRAQTLQLTPQGEQVHRAVQQQRRRLAALAAAGLSATERRQLVAWLDRVRLRLEQAGD